jgi:polyisoprenoid-binding protein YceI
MSRGSKVAMWIGGAIVGLIVLVVGGTWAYINVFSDDPAPEFSLDTTVAPTTPAASATTAAAPVDSSAPATTATTSAPAGGSGSWIIASGSQAGYRVKEVLFGQSTTAVGRTSEVTGSMTLDGSTVTAGDFTVDMASVESDKSQRDGQFRDRIMDTSTFPTSTFKLTQPIDLGSVPADGAEITASATGDLTLRGTTKSVTFDVQAVKNGDNIQVVGQIPIVFEEWGIPNPSFGPASTEDNGVLEFSLILAAG